VLQQVGNLRIMGYDLFARPLTRPSGALRYHRVPPPCSPPAIAPRPSSHPRQPPAMACDANRRRRPSVVPEGIELQDEGRLEDEAQVHQFHGVH
jgi:hypothetical protein